MLNKNRYTQLKKRERELARRFLKWNQKNKAFKHPKDDEIRAYCMLIHAEIESYIEAVARESIEISRSILENKSVANGVIFTIVSAMNRVFVDHELSKEDLVSGDKLARPKSRTEWIDICSTQAHRIVGSNNGIKADDLIRMYRPLGLDIQALDPIWLTDMTEMGKQRGNIAHTDFSAHQVPNPTDIKSRVDRIIAGCADLRERMVELCKTSGSGNGPVSSVPDKVATNVVGA